MEKAEEITNKLEDRKNIHHNRNQTDKTEVAQGLVGLIRKHIYVIIVPEEEEKEGGVEKAFKEVMAEKSSTSQI